MRTVAVAIVALVVSASACLAQSGQSEKRKTRAAGTPQPPAQTSNWTGLQTGANGGNSSLAQNFADPGAFLCPVYFGGCVETPFAFSGHPSSFTAGVFAGYREQFGILVIGIEGDVAWKKATTSLVQSGITPDYVSETFRGSLTQGWDGSLRGRLGVLLSPSLLAYATAGLAFGHVSGAFSYNALYETDSRIDSVSGAKSWNDIKLGYTLGGGLEAAIGMGLKLRLEYRFTDFGHFSENVPLTSFGCGGYVCGTNARIDMNAAFHTIRFGIGVDL